MEESKRVSGTTNFLCAYCHNYQVTTEAPCAIMWELIRKLLSSTQVQQENLIQSQRVKEHVETIMLIVQKHT